MGRAWWAEEEEALRAAVQRYGVGAWEAMRKDPTYKNLLGYRSGMQLKDKWRNLIKFGHLPVDEILAAPKRPVPPGGAAAAVAMAHGKPVPPGEKRASASRRRGGADKGGAGGRMAADGANSTAAAGKPGGHPPTRRQRSAPRRATQAAAAPSPPASAGAVASPEASLASAPSPVGEESTAVSAPLSPTSRAKAAVRAAILQVQARPQFEHLPTHSAEAAKESLEGSLRAQGMLGARGGLNLDDIREQFGGTAAAAIASHQRRLADGKAPLPPPIKRRATGKRKSRARPMEVPSGYKKGVRSTGTRRPRSTPWALVVPDGEGTLVRDALDGSVSTPVATMRSVSLTPDSRAAKRIRACPMPAQRGSYVTQASDTFSIDEYAGVGDFCNSGAAGNEYGAAGESDNDDEGLEGGAGAGGQEWFPGLLPKPTSCDGLDALGVPMGDACGVPPFHMPAEGPPPELVLHMQQVMRAQPMAAAPAASMGSAMDAPRPRAQSSAAAAPALLGAHAKGVSCDLLATALTYCGEGDIEAAAQAPKESLGKSGGEDESGGSGGEEEASLVEVHCGDMGLLGEDMFGCMAAEPWTMAAMPMPMTLGLADGHGLQ